MSILEDTGSIMSQMATNEEFENNENFADMLDNYLGNDGKVVNQVIEGKVVEIRESEGKVLIGIGEKKEPYIPLSEIQDSEGKILFKKGDTINVVVTSSKGGSVRVSYTKFLEQELTKKFIDEHGVEKIEGMVINGTIKSVSKKGYTLEENGVRFYLPLVNAFLSKKNDKDTGERQLQADKKVRAKVVKVDKDKNLIIVSRKRYIQDEIRKRQESIKNVLARESFQAKVIAVLKDRLVVDIDGTMKGYVSADEISHRGKVVPFKTNKPKDIVNVKAINYDDKERAFNLSIKAVTVDPWLEIQEKIEKGDTIEVTVSNIEKYGAFVDIGNEAEGFLHVSEISWDKKINSPADYLKVGDVIQVEVVEVNPIEHRLRVSRKRLLPKPFDLFTQKYRRGGIIEGEVTNLTEFGAFLKIDQVEGLLRNVDFDWNQNTKCKETLKIGDKVKVKISDIDTTHEKITLNRKVLLETPIQEFAKRHRVGEVVKGKIRDIKEFGAFITIGENVDALIRNEDMLPQNQDEFVKGLEIEGMIIAIDPKRDRIRLSVKRVERAKEQQLLKEFNNAGSNHNSSFGDLIKEKLR
jgi:small subunit ribosomal protein S1